LAQARLSRSGFDFGGGDLGALIWVVEQQYTLNLYPFGSGAHPGKYGDRGIFLLAVIMLTVDLGFRRVALLALFPAAIGFFTLLQDILPTDFGIDELVFSYFPLSASSNSARVSPPVSLALLVSGLLVASLARPRIGRKHTLILALCASTILSLGAATLMGYTLDLTMAYRWGYSHDTSPLAAFAIALVGVTLLAQAWHKHDLTGSGAPSWLPLPVIVGSATMTAILYMGLQDQELVRLKEGTNRSAQSLAREVEDLMEAQINQLGYFAREWADENKTAVVRGIEAESFLRTNIGCRGGQSISLISQIPDLTVQEVYPTEGNEHLARFPHGDNPVRTAAIQRSLSTSGAPVISGTIDLTPYGPGYAIYVPLKRENEVWGFLVGEYLYSRVIDEIVRADNALTDDYLVRVEISDSPIYDNTYTSTSIDDLLEPRGGISIVFSVFERRMRFTAVRTEEAFARDRRNLPELVGAAGFGITILLGLSVHLARAAYTSLRTAEKSNQRLKSENEERRRVEAMLKVSDERLRLALDSTQIGIFEWNTAANQVYYSPGLWNMLDYAPGDVSDTPKAWTQLIHEKDLPGYQVAVEKQLSGEETFIAPEYRLRTGKGEWRWIYARSKTVARGAHGEPLRIIGTIQDITDRKDSESALRESQAEARKLSLVASRTDNLVIISTPDGKVDWVNDSFTRVMEYDLDEIYGKTPDSFLLGPESRKRDVVRIRAAMARGEGVTTDIVNYSKSGRKYHLHLEIQPVFSESGEIETYIAILADITTRVATEFALRRAKREADDASRAKSEFLASMSHEIRTPMNGVIGMTSLLMDTAMDPEQRDFVNTIRTSGEALLTIINDILDFSKIESGKMELEELPFELPTCLEEALELFAMQAASKNLDLAYHVAEDVPPWVNGDITRLRQILVNLVNNAIKFTPNGSITITVRKKDSPHAALKQDRIKLEFTVADSGIGIPKDRISRLFRPFSQVDSSTTRKYGGTGLGLAICHRLTEIMGGTIRVESEEGKGTQFIFDITTTAAHAINADPLPALPAGIATSPVLIAEDNPVGRQHLQDFFLKWGSKPNTSGSVNETSQLLDSNRPPGIVLLDQDLITQPGGEELLTIVEKKKLPTLVLLSPGPDGAKVRLNAPHILSINKPVRTSTLIRRVQNLLHVKTETATRAPMGAKLSEEFPLKVLLVEDNLVNQKVASRFLNRLGYTAEVASNGLEGFNAVQKTKFDLVLMDLQMPEMDGFTASREIRKKIPEVEQPKIIALTANALQGDRELCLEAGMDDYLTKPVKLHDLSEAIRRQFSATPGETVPYTEA
jgi:PAS domain S-box-containing protein